MDKQYSVENIENLIRSPQSLISTVDQTMLLRAFRAESERLLMAYRQLLARVKELEAVEEMLKRYALENSTDGRLGETIYYDENKSQWCVQGFTDSYHARLYLALQSLIKE